ncbi:MAG: SH3 domain-containing protein [Synergistaceae bacterium]|jgi:SH3-like domain-containing protein|nr:SH3 domain-containing protein [Synergistaceae bacterium]
MNRPGRWLLMLIILAIALALPAAGSEKPAAEELQANPVMAVIAGTRVNVREGPSTAHKSLGQLNKEWIPVVDAAPGEEGMTWYKVLSWKLGEGWIREDLVDFSVTYEFGPAPVLMARIYRDLGVNPAMTEEQLGKPERIDQKVMDIDWKLKNVTFIKLIYPEGFVGFWRYERGAVELSDGDFTGGMEGLGGVRFGMGKEEVEAALGAPFSVNNERYKYFGAEDFWYYSTGIGDFLVCFSPDSRVERIIFSLNIP